MALLKPISNFLLVVGVVCAVWSKANRFIFFIFDNMTLFHLLFFSWHHFQQNIMIDDGNGGGSSGGSGSGGSDDELNWIFVYLTLSIEQKSVAE